VQNTRHAFLVAYLAESHGSARFLCGGSDAPRSDPPHNIMRYWI